MPTFVGRRMKVTRSSVLKRAISRAAILGRVVAVGHLGDVGLRLFALVHALDERR